MKRYFSIILLEILAVVSVVWSLSHYHTKLIPSKSAGYTQKTVISPVSYQEPAVLSEKTQLTAVTNTPTPVLTISPTQTSPLPRTLRKSSYQILLYGDSMEEVLGSNGQLLVDNLNTLYPQTTFKILNWSRGAENVEMALHRLEKLTIPPVDAIVVGSYSYNPFVPHSLGKHSQYLGQLLARFLASQTETYLLVEIAPIKTLFGRGVSGLDWDSNARYTHATNVIALLENSLKVANRLGVPAIDVFHESIIGPDKSGDLRYINSSDYIHPSVLGQQLTASLISERLELK